MFDKKILITGVAGFIGNHIALSFSQKKQHVFGIDIRPQEEIPLIDRYLSLKLPSDDIGTVIRDYQPDICIHCAGPSSVYYSVKNPVTDFNACALATLNLLDAMRQNSPGCKIVFLSSAAVYGNSITPSIGEDHPLTPISPYGFHKRIAEEICKEYAVVYGLKTACVRIFSAYGPGLKRQVLWDICRKAIMQPELILEGTGNETRDFVHVADIVSAINIIAEKGLFIGEVYNVASGRETLIRDLANLLLKSLNKPGCIRFNGDIAASIPHKWKADISKLRSMGYIPEITLENGIEGYVKWVRKELSQE
jgi:UDP-glucose 4-epimerase